MPYGTSRRLRHVCSCSRCDRWRPCRRVGESDYWDRSVPPGSMRTARRTGIRHATTVMTVNTMITISSTAGSQSGTGGRPSGGGAPVENARDQRKRQERADHESERHREERIRRHQPRKLCRRRSKRDAQRNLGCASGDPMKHAGEETDAREEHRQARDGQEQAIRHSSDPFLVRVRLSQRSRAVERVSRCRS